VSGLNDHMSPYFEKLTPVTDGYTVTAG